MMEKLHVSSLKHVWMESLPLVFAWSFEGLENTLRCLKEDLSTSPRERLHDFLENDCRDFHFRSI